MIPLLRYNPFVRLPGTLESRGGIFKTLGFCGGIFSHPLLKIYYYILSGTGSFPGAPAPLQRMSLRVRILKGEKGEASVCLSSHVVEAHELSWRLYSLGPSVIVMMAVAVLVRSCEPRSRGFIFATGSLVCLCPVSVVVCAWVCVCAQQRV